ncbi:hypothetical protein NLG97_g2796 [Lecanicillium saksenae]|uniref:Uncharacterized protein n=1 Tax=Lecanicillium saksenae TaxID=468837 RepID=A0ACC1R366_9HYPO|nr:hypothetical protein NLG97_g2796 [Lecanicillium saksenae]
MVRRSCVFTMYYNGSTTIRIEPKDFEEDTNKDTKVSYPVEVTYKNSILAIVKSNGYVEDQNELTFSLRYWDSNLNITPIYDSADGPINSIQNIDSVDMNRYYRPTGKVPPYWQLESSHNSETSYSFSGQRNFTVLQGLKFNCSECLSSSEFRGSIVNPSRRSGPDLLNVTSFPFEHEKTVFLARLNGQAGRYAETKKLMKKIIETGIEPSSEEQKLLSIAYSKLQHALRDSWRVMFAVEQEEKAKEGSDLIKLIEEARTGVETELESLCNEAISLVEDKIMPSATTAETRLFGLKMKADYNRYIAECTTEDKRPVKTDLASAAYGDAIKLAQEKFDAGNPHRLSVMVNAAVFYHDFVNMEERAIELTESELSKAMEEAADSTDADVRAIMHILHANLQLWKAEVEE